MLKKKVSIQQRARWKTSHSFMKADNCGVWQCAHHSAVFTQFHSPFHAETTAIMWHIDGNGILACHKRSNTHLHTRKGNCLFSRLALVQALMCIPATLMFLCKIWIGTIKHYSKCWAYFQEHANPADLKLHSAFKNNFLFPLILIQFLSTSSK